MATKLYGLSISHPALAARLMLELKGIEHEVRDLVPGTQPLVMRARGFSRATVPALKIGDQRVQGSLEISRALDRLQPEPPLFPSDPEQRRAVEEAEAWGEAELQALVRRLFRWSLANRQEARRWVAGEIANMPAPGFYAAINMPVARWFARGSGADDETVRDDLARLPQTLDRVDELIEAGTIGGTRANAADCQIASSVRVLLEFPDLEPLVTGRPAAELARRLFPRYPGPVPVRLPGDWVPEAAPALRR
jgi:glutathione S-transferase